MPGFWWQQRGEYKTIGEAVVVVEVMLIRQEKLIQQEKGDRVVRGSS